MISFILEVCKRLLINCGMIHFLLLINYNNYIFQSCIYIAAFMLVENHGNFGQFTSVRPVNLKVINEW